MREKTIFFPFDIIGSKERFLKRVLFPTCHTESCTRTPCEETTGMTKKLEKIKLRSVIKFSPATSYITRGVTS
jgi:hypothetical protein